MDNHCAPPPVQEWTAEAFAACRPPLLPQAQFLSGLLAQWNVPMYVYRFEDPARSEMSSQRQRLVAVNSPGSISWRRGRCFADGRSSFACDSAAIRFSVGLAMSPMAHGAGRAIPRAPGEEPRHSLVAPGPGCAIDDIVPELHALAAWCPKRQRRHLRHTQTTGKIRESKGFYPLHLCASSGGLEALESTASVEQTRTKTLLHPPGAGDGQSPLCRVAGSVSAAGHSHTHLAVHARTRFLPGCRQASAVVVGVHLAASQRSAHDTWHPASE